MYQFVNKQVASEKLNLSCATLKKYRLNGTLVEGTHWIKVNCRCIRYNLELIQDWLRNRCNPTAHNHAIYLYHVSIRGKRRRG
jgi:tRNA(His) 5'-end guanylyltransferase